MQPEIRKLDKTKLVGKRKSMSLAENKTGDLWRGFMPRKSEIKNIVGNELYSIEIYHDQDFFRNFNPNGVFEKWAAVEVSNFDAIPDGLEKLVIPEGIYAVFLYKGKASNAALTYQYIFSEWLPNSEYSLDNRPHLAIMGEKYKNDDPNSEEELWIPVKNKLKVR